MRAAHPKPVGSLRAARGVDEVDGVVDGVTICFLSFMSCFLWMEMRCKRLLLRVRFDSLERTTSPRRAEGCRNVGRLQPELNCRAENRVQ